MPYAYDAGLSPSEVRGATFGELLAAIQAQRRREARALELHAWTVAHLLVGGGTLRKGTHVSDLMRELLGRGPDDDAAPPTLSPEASVVYMKAYLQARFPARKA